MTVIYNDTDAYVAAWLRNLSAQNLIAKGVVDERSIADLEPPHTATQFHAFAGIGVWSYALRLAGWPDDAPVWTGSCPCQPFSDAGAKRGTDDPRHLWPAWRRLIAECRPTVVFGEQVASPLGRSWLDAVSADLEGLGYAVGAADLCAAGVGAPHRRQRLYFVAYTDNIGCPELAPSWLHAPGKRRYDVAGRGIDDHGVGNAGCTRSGGHAGAISRTQAQGDRERGEARRESYEFEPSSAWANTALVQCRDGKTRPIEPGTFPLAHGVARRVGRLRAYGNAIVAPLAATFIRAFLDCVS